MDIKFSEEQIHEFRTNDIYYNYFYFEGYGLVERGTDEYRLLEALSHMEEQHKQGGQFNEL